MMTTPEILRGAAKETIRQGWRQHARHHPDGGVCALGALENAVYAGQFYKAYAEDICPDAVMALAALLLPPSSTRISPATDASLLKAVITVVDWNNAPEQTQENVVMTFELAALMAEEKEKYTADIIKLGPVGVLEEL